MNEKIQANYYAIIPAGVRYNKELKFAERLLYGEITALSNIKGYCFATNKYFASLYDVSSSTISRWISHWADLGYIEVELIRNDNKEIVERRLYVLDTPYTQNNQYPYMQNNTYPIRKKSKENIININMIDRFFNYIINKEAEIPEEFLNIDKRKILNILEKYEMLYTKENIEYISNENLIKIKEIIYALGLIAKNDIQNISNRMNRDKLIEIYNACKQRQIEYQDTENSIENFVSYYYTSIVNELTRNKGPCFFMPKNDVRQDEKLEESEEL